jgi:5'-phosphate synthase pdxT subunit
MASARRIGVLALQGDVREHRAVLESLGETVVEVRRPDHLDDVEALVLPGGESTTLSMLLESAGLFDPIKERLAAGMPAFGTCAGMILLAEEVLDGRDDQRSFGAIAITARRNAFGRQVESFESELDIKGLDEPMHAVFIRAPIVEAVREPAEVLASVRFGDGRDRPVVCRQARVLVASFHPELAGDARLHQLFLDQLREQGE